MTNSIRRAGLVVVCALAPACGNAADGASQATGESASELAVTAAGSIPAGLPSHLSVGLFEGSGGSWMKASGVPWDVRYAYFTYGWANNWGYGAHDGSWGLNYLNESSAAGYVPAVQYYVVNGEPGGAEAQFLAKTQNATTMAEYFGDFKLLMQNIKTFGKPVVVLMEADGYGFLEQQSNGNPNTYAAVADSGLPELSSLPNTVAGWGLAFLQLRKAVGATNAVVGIHVSDWAGGEDIGYGSVTDALQPQVDAVYKFLSPLGLAANSTGATYDFLVGDPLDRDSDYYKVVENQNRWWDASDTASVNSESFNRYGSWLSLWNAKAGKRWILWQIPIGNSNQLDVCNSGQARQGYKDNRAEYFFGPESAQHLAAWAQDGVVGLLFGAGEGCQSSYQNDNYTDGQPFLKTHVGAFYAAGGLPLTSGGGAGSSSGTTSSSGSGSGSSSGSGGTTPEYGFETSTQGWSGDSGVSKVSVSAAQEFAGGHSLAVTLNETNAGTATVAVSSPATPAGATVTFHVFIPSGTTVSAVQPFAAQGAQGSWAWTGNWQATSSLKTGAWNTITVVVPANAITPLYQLGVQIQTSGASKSTVYIDSVAW